MARNWDHIDTEGTGETYNDEIVRMFLLAAAVWGIVGMSIGVFAAAQLAWPWLNFDIPWLTFSRIRPNHTFGIIFGFGVSAVSDELTTRPQAGQLAEFFRRPASPSLAKMVRW